MKNIDVDKLLRQACAARRASSAPDRKESPVDYLLISRYLEGVAGCDERRAVEAMARTNADVAELLQPMQGTAQDPNAIMRLTSRWFQTPWSRTLLRCAAAIALIITGALCVGYVARSGTHGGAQLSTGAVAATERVLVFRGIQCPYAPDGSNTCDVTISVAEPTPETAEP